MLKIAITGPESSGKTALSQALAGYFQTVWTPEYARHYLRKSAGVYAYPDLLRIARGQLQWQQRDAARARDILFCDTDLIVMKVWSDYRFGQTDPWIIAQLERNPYHLTLLCHPDIPWEPGPLRENPHDRQELLLRYRQELQRFHIPFVDIQGDDFAQREEYAVSAVLAFIERQSSLESL